MKVHRIKIVPPRDKQDAMRSVVSRSCSWSCVSERAISLSCPIMLSVKYRSCLGESLWYLQCSLRFVCSSSRGMRPSSPCIVHGDGASDGGARLRISPSCFQSLVRRGWFLHGILYVHISQRRA